MSDTGGDVSLFSWPCSSTCSLSALTMFLVMRSAYSMGENSRDKKPAAISNYWMLCAAVIVLCCTWSVIKFID